MSYLFRYSEANALLQQQLTQEESPGRRGDWWNRLSVNHSHLGQTKEALSVCENALADPFVRTGDRLKLEKRLIRLCKPPARWKVPSHLLYQAHVCRGFDARALCDRSGTFSVIVRCCLGSVPVLALKISLFCLTFITTLTKAIKNPKKIIIRGKMMEAGVAGKKSVFKGYDSSPCSVEVFY